MVAGCEDSPLTQVLRDIFDATEASTSLTTLTLRSPPYLPLGGITHGLATIMLSGGYRGKKRRTNDGQTISPMNIWGVRGLSKGEVEEGAVP